MNCKINLPSQLCCQLPVNEKITMLEQVATNTFSLNSVSHLEQDVIILAAMTCYYQTIRLLLQKDTKLF